jgi:hypothetical protein
LNFTKALPIWEEQKENATIAASKRVYISTIAAIELLIYD